MLTQPERRLPSKKTSRGSGTGAEPGVVLPPGYRLQMGVNLLVLHRADRSMVAAFSASGADPAEVAKAAEEKMLKRTSHKYLPSARV